MLCHGNVVLCYGTMSCYVTIICCVMLQYNYVVLCYHNMSCYITVICRVMVLSRVILGNMCYMLFFY